MVHEGLLFWRTGKDSSCELIERLNVNDKRLVYASGKVGTKIHQIFSGLFL